MDHVTFMDHNPLLLHHEGIISFSSKTFHTIEAIHEGLRINFPKETQWKIDIIASVYEKWGCLVPKNNPNYFLFMCGLLSS